MIAVPKTMDNDVHGTDYSIGFSTAITRSVHFIGDLRTAAGSQAPPLKRIASGRTRARSG